MINNLNIQIDRDSCIACGTCVDRCIMDNLRLSVAPCRQACPLGTNCQGYIRLVARGREEDAAKELRKNTPFGGILGHVCNHPCEARCERETATGDGAVHIRAIKRYLAETFPEITSAVPEKAPPSGKSVAIVGSGPAGLMAAYELAVAGHGVTLYEAAEKAGGMLRYGVPAYRLPERVLERALKLLGSLGVTMQTGARLGKELALDSLRKDYDAVLLAVGLREAARPAIDGANLPGVYDAIDILRAVREGEKLPVTVSSAVVVGGGATAMDAALTLRKLGVNVTMVALERKHEMPVEATEIEEAVEEDVIMKNRWAVSTIRAKGQKLHLELQRCVGLLDAQGRFAPELDEAPSSSMQTDMVVFATGQRLDTSLDGIPFSTHHLVAIDPANGQVPEAEKIFAAGDCTSGATSVVKAFASGKKVALCMDRYLKDMYPLAVDDWTESGKVQEYVSDLSRSDGRPRSFLDRIPTEKRTLTAEVENLLSSAQAQQQASRCLSCGRPFDANKTCWACLPCELDCPEKALTLRIPYYMR